MSGTDTLCTFFNKAWLEFTGRTMGQEVGNGWTDGVHRGDLPRCLDTYLSSCHARRPFHMEYRLRRADGQYRWINDTGVPRYTPHGEFAGHIGSCVDVTDAKAAVAALASEVETTRALFESVAEAIVVVNEAGGIVRINDRGATMLGYTRGELSGQPVESLLPERLRAAHRARRAA